MCDSFIPILREDEKIQIFLSSECGTIAYHFMQKHKMSIIT